MAPTAGGDHHHHRDSQQRADGARHHKYESVCDARGLCVRRNPAHCADMDERSKGPEHDGPPAAYERHAAAVKGHETQHQERTGRPFACGQRVGEAPRHEVVPEQPHMEGDQGEEGSSRSQADRPPDDAADTSGIPGSCCLHVVQE